MTEGGASTKKCSYKMLLYFETRWSFGHPVAFRSPFAWIGPLRMTTAHHDDPT